MTVFDLIPYIYALIFTVLQASVMAGFFIVYLRDRKWLCNKQWLLERRFTGQERALSVSLVIPVHNESGRMKSLLQSLLKQDYPAEIIFVDDRSTDKSPSMLSGFVREAALQGMNGCKIVTLTENPGPNRKQYALSAGIARARGDYFLFTDGDCEVPPGWIRAMARRMGDPLTGAVIGPVLKKKQGRGFFSLYQCYDQAVRYNYLAGPVGLGAAGGGFGNNLIVSKAALEDAGGYDAVPPSPTEDAALISLIRSKGKFRIRAAALPDTAVETEAEETWGGFISQTLRWNNGGLFSPDPVTRFNYNLLMLFITTGILAIPLLPFFPNLWPMPAAVIFVMIQNTAAVFSLFRKKLPKGGFLNSGYLLTMLFTPVYFSLMTVMGYCKVKVKWKGEAVV